LDSRAGEPSPARGDVEEVSRSLLRVVTILGRYTQDTATAFRDVPHRTLEPASPWSRARVEALDALAAAAGFLLHPAAGRPAWPSARSASPLARRLDEMAAVLAAGRDLLHTHFAPGPRGRVHQSAWAPIITSEQVNRALLAELGALARPAAHYGANVALAPVPGAPARAGQRRALNAACQWLWVFAASVDAAGHQQPVLAADRDLLAAIPVNALPARPVLADADTTPSLCDAVINTAERLRHLAWQAAQQPPWTPAFTVTSLRQAAEASALTNHHSVLLADALTARTSQGAFPAASADMAAAAQAARRAAHAWFQAARALRQVTTDTRGQVTPAAAEALDLAWWTGRLAHADTAWTLASGPGCTPRSPQQLAPRPEDLPHVVAAVHQATDVLALLAETEHHQLRGAARAGRILVPTRTLDCDYDIPRPYGPAPQEIAGTLLARYRDATQASRQATTDFGHAAHATGAPSRILATARELTHPTSPATQATDRRDEATHLGPDKAEDMPGPLQNTLLGLGVTRPALLARGAELDKAAQCLLIEAADEPPLAHNWPLAITLNGTAATAALLNHALASGESHAAQLLRRPGQHERAEQEPEWEP
jgi:hypothetical protein